MSIFTFILGVFFFFAQEDHSFFFKEVEREMNRCEESSDIDDIQEKDGKSIAYKYSTDDDNSSGAIPDLKNFSVTYNLVFKSPLYLKYISNHTAFYLLYCCLRIPSN